MESTARDPARLIQKSLCTEGGLLHEIPRFSVGSFAHPPLRRLAQARQTGGGVPIRRQERVPPSGRPSKANFRLQEYSTRDEGSCLAVARAAGGEVGHSLVAAGGWLRRERRGAVRPPGARGEGRQVNRAFVRCGEPPARASARRELCVASTIADAIAVASPSSRRAAERAERLRGSGASDCTQKHTGHHAGPSRRRRCAQNRHHWLE